MAFRFVVCSAGMILILAVLSSFGKPGSDPWLIPPAGAEGAITSRTSQGDLMQHYGEPNVRDADVDIGEGETEPGTVLFPGDSQREIWILWKDADRKRFPKSIQIFGKRSLWKTAHGITLGSSLKDLERLNGRPFSLMGFEWDYGGTVMSWKGGALEDVKSGHVIVRLSPPSDDTPNPEINKVAGESELSSSDPAMQKINPLVYHIVWQFP